MSPSARGIGRAARLTEGVACAIALAVGCSSTSPEPSKRSSITPPASPTLDVAVVAHPFTAMPTPAPLARVAFDDPAELNARCEGCHVEEAREWHRSQHRSSWEDPVFLAAYALEPQPFCRSCHAPEAELRSSPSPSSRRVGVGCITCHQPAGPVLDAAPSGLSAPHPVTYLEAYGSPGACVGCHDFDFPFDPGTPMQSTAREHAVRGDAPPCADCHMPLVANEDGRLRRRHDFEVIGDAAMLASAVRVLAAWHEGGVLEVELARGDVGHGVPTGDMFRRVELRVTLLDEAGEVLATPPSRVFARSFAEAHEGSVMTRRPTGDTRLFVDPTEHTRRVWIGVGSEPRARTIRYELVHMRMDLGLAALFGVPAQLVETPFARGEVEIPRAAPLARGRREP